MKKLIPLGVAGALATFLIIPGLAQQITLPMSPTEVMAPAKGSVIHPGSAKAVGRLDRSGFRSHPAGILLRKGDRNTDAALDRL